MNTVSAAGFTRSRNNPPRRASSSLFVSKQKMVQLITVLVPGGTTGSYGSGFRCDNSRKRPWKGLVSNKLWWLLKRLA